MELLMNYESWWLDNPRGYFEFFSADVREIETNRADCIAYTV